MAGIQNLAIKFETEALPANTLVVTRLTGEERLSRPFRFELDLMSRDARIDLEKVLYAPARLGLEASTHKEGRAFRWFHGALESLTELDHTHGLTRYRAVLQPDLWRLSQYSRCRIFQKKTIDEMVGDALEADLSLQPDQDFEFRLSRTAPGGRRERPVYPEREYTVQYEETDLSFVSRWLEHEGIFYFFENDGTREKVVFADAATAYKPARSGPPLRFHPEGGGGERGGGGATASGIVEEITSFTCVQTREPGSIKLVDYNWRIPAVELAATADAQASAATASRPTSASSASGGEGEAGGSTPPSTGSAPEVIAAMGRSQAYNDNVRTIDEGKALARVRLEEGHAQARLFYGKGNCRAFRPGRTFALERHFRPDFDAGYVLLAVRHEADQAVNFDAGTVTSSNYQNTFEAMPKERTYRPARVTPWPAIKGTIHAFVDSAGEGDFADLDDDGRYLLRIPFDERESDQKARAPAGYASRRVRMAQPYAGVEGGFHFPLLKGTEVLLTHIDGDPDRPVIAAAIPNAQTPSPTHQANHKQNRVTTTSGNALVLDDDLDLAGYVMIDAGWSHVRDLRRAASAPSEEERPDAGSAGEPGAPRARRPSRLSEAARRAAAAGPPLPPGLLARRGLGGGRAGDDTLGATADPTVVDAYNEGDEDRLDLWSGAEAELSKARGKVEPGEPSLFAPGYKFEADQYDTTVAIDDGLKVEVLNGSRYTYDNCAPCVTISTADGHAVTFTLGDQLEESTFTGKLTEVSSHTGNKESTETFMGDSMTTSTHVGNDIETTTHVGNTLTTSTHIGLDTSTDVSVGASLSTSLRAGNDTSMEVFTGVKTSVGLTVARELETSVTLGGKVSSSLTITGEVSSEVSIGPRTSSSLTVGPAVKGEVTIGPALESSITIGPKTALGLTISNESATSIVLGSKAETTLSIGAASELKLTLGATSSVELALGVKSEIGVFVGAAGEINVFAGGQMKIDISASILLEIAIAAAVGLRINISADGVKEITIPKKEEITIENSMLCIKKGGVAFTFDKTGLMHFKQ